MMPDLELFASSAETSLTNIADDGDRGKPDAVEEDTPIASVPDLEVTRLPNVGNSVSGSQNLAQFSTRDEVGSHIIFAVPKIISHPPSIVSEVRDEYAGSSSFLT